MAGYGRPDQNIVVSLHDVSVVRDGRALLDRIDWEVRSGDRWVVLGPNGSGKSTLVRVASMHLHPTTGVVELLGERLGRTDVRRLRARVGVVSAAVADALRGDLPAIDVVMTARFGALEPWWHEYEPRDRDRAYELLDRFDVGAFGDRRFASLSSGERQRVLLARGLMSNPGLIVLDEPSAGLDLPGREDLVDALAVLALDDQAPATVLVTHHVEEIPPGFTHALLLRAGQVVASGELAPTLTAGALSDCMGLELALDEYNGRFSARRV